MTTYYFECAGRAGRAHGPSEREPQQGFPQRHDATLALASLTTQSTAFDGYWQLVQQLTSVALSARDNGSDMQDQEWETYTQDGRAELRPAIYALVSCSDRTNH